MIQALEAESKWTLYVCKIQIKPILLKSFLFSDIFIHYVFYDKMFRVTRIEKKQLQTRNENAASTINLTFLLL